MAVPFSSAYAPINTLNDAIQAQNAMAQQGFLEGRKITNQGIADSLNRAVQQEALKNQAAAQQAHYGLQQQQLANDLAYRNAALAQHQAQQVEAARQFDKTYGLNEQITKAQINNPLFGAGKDFAAYGLQAWQNVEEHNKAADSLSSQATGSLISARQRYQAAIDSIRKPNIGEQAKRLIPGTDTQGDQELAAKKAFDLELEGIYAKLGADRNKVLLVGQPEINGVFHAVHLNPPRMPGMGQPQAPFDGSEGPDAGPVNIGTPDLTTPENQPVATANPFLRYGTGPGGMISSAAQAIAQRLGGMNASPFSNFGRPTNAPPLVVTPPSTNRVFTLTPDGRFVPAQ